MGFDHAKELIRHAICQHQKRVICIVTINIKWRQDSIQWRKQMRISGREENAAIAKQQDCSTHVKSSKEPQTAAINACAIQEHERSYGETWTQRKS